MEQSDIVPVLKSFVIEDTEQGLIIKNPPIIKLDDEEEEEDNKAKEWVSELLADADRNSGA